MSISKPFTFTANTYAKANEVNADFDTLYSQVNSNISAISQNATDIDNLENTKANTNGNSSQRFAVADAVTNSDAINKGYLIKAMGNSVDYISGLVVTKDSSSQNDTISVSDGSCYDSTKTVILSLSNSVSKQNANQGANATYYVYIIGNATGSSTDVLISDNSSSPALPSGYTLYRKIGYYTTNGDSNIDIINYYGYNTSAPQAIATIIDSYVNGTSWYRIWSDGWCEQGGYVPQSTDNITVMLLKQMADTNYSIKLTSGANVAPSVAYYAPVVCPSSGIATDRFKVNMGNGSNGVYLYWQVSGQKA